jgi:hypothetical protein
MGKPILPSYYHSTLLGERQHSFPDVAEESQGTSMSDGGVHREMTLFRARMLVSALQKLRREITPHTGHDVPPPTAKRVKAAVDQAIATFRVAGAT